MFFCEYCKIVKNTPILQNIRERLFLNFIAPNGEIFALQYNTNRIKKTSFFSFQTDSPMQLNRYDIKQPLFTGPNYYNRGTFSNFFGENKEHITIMVEQQLYLKRDSGAVVLL